MCLRSRIMCELFHTQQKEIPGVENVPAERKDTWEVNSTGLSLAGALLIISCTAFARRKIVGGSLRTLKYQCSSIFVKNWLKFPWCTMMSPLFHHKYWLSFMKSYLHAMVPFKLEWIVSISHVLWTTAGFSAWMRKFDLVFLYPSPILELEWQGQNSSCKSAEWPWGPPSLWDSCRGYFVGVKWLCHGIDHSSPSSVRIEKVRQTSSSPLWLHGHLMAWYLTSNSVLRQLTSFWTAHSVDSHVTEHMCNVF